MASLVAVDSVRCGVETAVALGYLHRRWWFWWYFRRVRFSWWWFS
jgi:hypothetical protein